MYNSQRYRQTRRSLKIFLFSLLLFAASPNHAVAYGGHGYHYGHGYGYHGYRHYGHHGYGYGAYYSHHGGIGTAGYVFLGILGVAVLSQIMDNNNDRYRDTRKTHTYKQPTYNQSRSYTLQTQPRQFSIDNKSKSKPVYIYSKNEGWDWLAKGNASYALDIFAIQSQQNMNSGIPKVGFAIAAATNGEMDRATRAMRKAIRIDVTALDKINIKNIRSRIETLSEDYKLLLNNNKNNPDNAFMVATLSYLQQDYITAISIISENDHSQSANKLRELLAKKEG